MPITCGSMAMSTCTSSEFALFLFLFIIKHLNSLFYLRLTHVRIGICVVNVQDSLLLLFLQKSLIQFLISYSESFLIGTHRQTALLLVEDWELHLKILCFLFFLIRIRFLLLLSDSFDLCKFLIVFFPCNIQARIVG